MEEGVCVNFERVVSDTKPDIKSIQDTVSELNSGGKKVTDLKDGLKEKWTGAFAKYIIGKLNKPGCNKSWMHSQWFMFRMERVLEVVVQMQI
jgi:hypothetical protein